MEDLTETATDRRVTAYDQAIARQNALELAIKTQTGAEPTALLIERAEEFYQFLRKGETPCQVAAE